MTENEKLITEVMNRTAPERAEQLMRAIERERDWQVLALVPLGVIEVDCNSGDKRLWTFEDEKQSQKQAGEYRAEEWDE